MPFPSPEDLPHPGIKSGTADRFFTAEPPGKPEEAYTDTKCSALLHSRVRSGFWSLNEVHDYIRQAVSLGIKIMTWRNFAFMFALSPVKKFTKDVVYRMQ